MSFVDHYLPIVAVADEKLKPKAMDRIRQSLKLAEKLVWQSARLL